MAVRVAVPVAVLVASTAVSVLWPGRWWWLAPVPVLSLLAASFLASPGYDDPA